MADEKADVVSMPIGAPPIVRADSYEPDFDDDDTAATGTGAAPPLTPPQAATITPVRASAGDTKRELSTATAALSVAVPIAGSAITITPSVASITTTTTAAAAAAAAAGVAADFDDETDAAVDDGDGDDLPDATPDIKSLNAIAAANASAATGSDTKADDADADGWFSSYVPSAVAAAASRIGTRPTRTMQTRTDSKAGSAAGDTKSDAVVPVTIPVPIASASGSGGTVISSGAKLLPAVSGGSSAVNANVPTVLPSSTLAYDPFRVSASAAFYAAGGRQPTDGGGGDESKYCDTPYVGNPELRKLKKLAAEQPVSAAVVSPAPPSPSPLRASDASDSKSAPLSAASVTPAPAPSGGPSIVISVPVVSSAPAIVSPSRVIVVGSGADSKSDPKVSDSKSPATGAGAAVTIVHRNSPLFDLIASSAAAASDSKSGVGLKRTSGSSWQSDLFGAGSGIGRPVAAVGPRVVTANPNALSPGSAVTASSGGSGGGIRMGRIGAASTMSSAAGYSADEAHPFGSSFSGSPSAAAAAAARLNGSGLGAGPRLKPLGGAPMLTPSGVAASVAASSPGSLPTLSAAMSSLSPGWLTEDPKLPPIGGGASRMSPNGNRSGPFADAKSDSRSGGGDYKDEAVVFPADMKAAMEQQSAIDEILAYAQRNKTGAATASGTAPASPQTGAGGATVAPTTPPAAAAGSGAADSSANPNPSQSAIISHLQSQLVTARLEAAEAKNKIVALNAAKSVANGRYDVLQVETKSLRSRVEQLTAEAAAQAKQSAAEMRKLSDEVNLLRVIKETGDAELKRLGDALAKEQETVKTLNRKYVSFDATSSSWSELLEFEANITALHRSIQSALRTKLTAERDAAADSKRCLICEDRAIDCVLIPCGHCILCAVCAKQVELCPIDRKRIASRVETFGR